MYNKIYVKHLYSVYTSRFLYITLIFSSLIFIMNILEELKFFNDNQEIGIGYPIILTILNLPSILFEIFPFIILITTQFFFIKFQNNEEILIFKNNGINNLKLISYICLLVFIFGTIIISLFHFISSNMKNNYLEIKNNYTKDNKYLAVVNENGLWIKDKFEDQFMMIHSEKIEKNVLKNLVITTYNEDFISKNNIIGREAIITNNLWKIKDVIIIDSFGNKKTIETLDFKTNFNYIKINSLFSNLEALTILELIQQKKDFESVGLSSLDIDIQLNKIFSLPISLVLFALLSSILMFNIKFKKSKTFMVILGILLSVITYYIYYFFGLLGSNNKIPVILAIWFPNLILLLSASLGIIKINEK